MNSYRFTTRMERIFEIARDGNEKGIIVPVDLFIAACKEGTGVCGELYLYLRKHLGDDFIHQIDDRSGTLVRNGYVHLNHLKISEETSRLLKRAGERKDHYGQTLINEGHVIQSILESDERLGEVLSDEVKAGIIDIACVPRDLIVHLPSFSRESLSKNKNAIRRADHADLSQLRSFITQEFGERWLHHLHNVEAEKRLPIFIAERDGEIIGFACYDLVRNKKGLFGPMGTSCQQRFHSVGKELLYTCLQEMSQMGYEYAVIGEAGPIEFYEKSCQAKLI
ncbi:GNAT family N-acetyltransferase [Halobacillus litoralis]|uniref:GNAT family N-acetyltransferase n=1 Tax=Halobacillus litoralis TaxID=45668 RepID=UPI001CFDA484|nr:GNAT family N-acetyltransferase [Halobacillus litoralis]